MVPALGTVVMMVGFLIHIWVLGLSGYGLGYLKSWAQSHSPSRHLNGRREFWEVGFQNPEPKGFKYHHLEPKVRT